MTHQRTNVWPQHHQETMTLDVKCLDLVLDGTNDTLQFCVVRRDDDELIRHDDDDVRQ